MSDIFRQARAYLSNPQPYDLTIRQLAVMQVICDDDGIHKVHELAKALGVQKPIITRAANKLCALGLAERRRGTDDRRDMFIVPTVDGRVWRSGIGGACR